MTNKSRKNAPDLMGSFLGGDEAKTPKKSDSPRRRGRPSSEEPKSNATFSLPLDLQHELEKSWIDLRRDISKSVAKSDITRIALEIVIEEYRRKGSLSPLYQKLVELQDAK